MNQPDDNAAPVNWALYFAKHGLPVIPIPPRSKAPTLKDWPNQATIDSGKIEVWFNQAPEGNYGIVTTGHAAIDIDPRHGGHLWLDDNEYRLPETWRFWTGGGGLHLLYKAPIGRTVANRVNIAPGVDVRGDRGQIVGPGSIHPDGGRYAVKIGPDDCPIAVAPDWLIQEIERPASNGNSEPEVDLNAGPIPEGARNHTLACICGHLFKAHGTEKVREELHQINIERCKPPLFASEVDRIAASIAHREANQQIDGSASRETHIYSLYNEREYEPGNIMWAVEDFIPEGFSILAGRPKIGKSWLLDDIAVNVARGRQVARSFPTESTGVLFIALEDDRNSLIRRFDKMEIERDDYPENCFISHQWPAGLDCISALDSFLMEHPEVKLLLIDTLQHVLSPDEEESYRATSRELRPYQALSKKHGAAILGVLHTRKTKAIKDDEFDPLDFDNILGSRAYSAIADCLIMMHRVRNEKVGRLAVTGRNIEDAIYEAEFSATSWKFSTVDRKLTRRQQIAEFFKQHTEVEISPLDLCQRLGQVPEKHQKAMQECLRRMAKEDVIERVEYGRYRARRTQDPQRSCNVS